MENTTLTRNLNLRRDVPDSRDYPFSRITLKSPVKATRKLVPIDLRTNPLDPPIRDQGNLGACSAFATTALVNFCRDKQRLPDFLPAPLFTYYTTRQIRGTINTDSGATMREALKSTVDYGVVSEALWPYDITKYKVAPPSSVYNQALQNQTLQYFRIQDGNIAQMKRCLADGYPFIFGFYVFPQFQSPQALVDGIVQMPPNRTGRGNIGGHALMAIGWKKINNADYFICQNSWGNYGDKGFWYMPATYLRYKRLAFDFWTIRLMES